MIEQIIDRLELLIEENIISCGEENSLMCHDRNFGVIQAIECIKKMEKQPKTNWIPCEVKDIIDTIISHNEIVALWVEEQTEDVRYDKQIWRGMAWDVPKVYKECKFIKIFGTVPESIVEADTINIRIELSEEAKLSMHRKETREPITPAYAYKKEGAENECN